MTSLMSPIILWLLLSILKTNCQPASPGPPDDHGELLDPIMMAGKTKDEQNGNDYLPDELSPALESGSDAAPIFLREPEDAYIIRNKPAMLRCVAAHALRVYFECSGGWGQDKHEEYPLVDPMTGVREIESSLEVSRSAVEQFFGGEFACHCTAWSSQKGEIVSRKAVVTNAYLKKHFLENPYSVRVKLGVQVQLRCVPPEGVPPPEISWLKDGEPLKFAPDQDHVLIQSSEGHLIFPQVRVQDVGNYSCVAQNVAARRISDPAQLLIQGEGKWSPWSAWSACSVTCGTGFKIRTRTCQADSLGTAVSCFGESVRQMECSNVCEAIDGAWSEWSSWSTCNPECLHYRRRSCTEPVPQFGGKACSGLDLEAGNCTGGMCSGDRASVVAYGTTEEAHPASLQTDMALYIGLGLGIAIVFVAGFCLVRYYQSKRLRHGHHAVYTPAHPASGSHEEKKGLEFKFDNLMQKVCCEYDYTNPPGGASTTSTAPEESEHYYELPLTQRGSSNVVGIPMGSRVMKAPLPPAPPSSPPPSAIGGGTAVTSTPKRHMSPFNNNDMKNMLTNSSHLSRSIESLHSGTMSSHKSSAAQTEDNLIIMAPTMSSTSSKSTGVGSSTPASGLPTKLNSVSPCLPPPPPISDPGGLVVGKVTHEGGRLGLPDAHVILTVPEGAVPQGLVKEIFLAVLRDDRDRPLLPEGETLLSPVVMCGPVGMELQKPVIISFQHCASLQHGHWNISVLSSSDLEMPDPSSWKHVVRLGEESVDTPVFTQLDSTHCHLIVEQFGCYALVGKSTGGCAVKSLQLAVFATCSSPTAQECSLRLYSLDDTQAALQGVISSEKNMNGFLVEKPAAFLFQDGGGGLNVQLEDIGSNWRPKPHSSEQEIPFSHVWNARQNGLHCAFTLERVSESNLSTGGSGKSASSESSTLTCAIRVSQPHSISPTSLPLPIPRKKTIRIRHELCSQNSQVQQAPFPQLARSDGTSSSGCSSTDNVTEHEPVSLRSVPGFWLSTTCRNQLSKSLDGRGKGWMQLARALGMDRYLDYFASRPSPTEAILDLWEARNSDRSAVGELVDILQNMGRRDIAKALQTHLTSFPRGRWV